MGLTISHRVAKALGDEIALESEVGQGSAFTLWLPLQKPPATPLRPAADAEAGS